MAEDGTMTQAAFAREIGVSDERVRQYRKAGIFSMTPDGRIDVEEAKAALAAHGDSGKSNTKRRLYKDHEGARPNTEIGPDDNLQTQHLKAKIDYQFERARLAKLKADEQEGLLIEREQVQRDIFAVFRTARNMMLSVPDRVAAQLAGLHDKKDVHRVLTEELERCAEEFAEKAAAGELDDEGE